VAIVFTVTVSENSWDEQLGGWRCPALRIPGAMIDAVYESGSRVDSSWYEVLGDHKIVRWTRESRPAEVTLSLTLTLELSTKDSTDHWKKMAIALPAVATVLAALITASIPAIFSNDTNNKAQTITESSTSKKVTSEKLEVEDVRIMMPRGDKVMISWKDMPDEAPADDLLRKNGISLSNIDEATKLVYAALAQKDPEIIRYGPLILGNKFASGYAHSVFKAGPSSAAGYKEFQLFQGPSEFTLLVHMNDEESGPIPAAEIGINWTNVRKGLKNAIMEMYKNTRTVEFNPVALFVEGDGSWEYRIPYRVHKK
jgi:hypothetical protein